MLEVGDLLHLSVQRWLHVSGTLTFTCFIDDSFVSLCCGGVVEGDPDEGCPSSLLPLSPSAQRSRIVVVETYGFIVP